MEDISKTNYVELHKFGAKSRPMYVLTQAHQILCLLQRRLIIKTNSYAIT